MINPLAIIVTGLGTAIGFMTGNPGWGYMIGSTLGNWMFPPDGPNQEGPRMDDLTVTTSTYGLVRPIGWGTIRQAGNIIWAAPVREGRYEKDNVTYFRYYLTFAVAFGEGPAERLARVWLDDELAYDERGTRHPVRSRKPWTGGRSSAFEFDFYPGDFEQEPAPEIVADKGAEWTPAFRGTCFALIKDLFVGEGSWHVPNVTAEVVYTAEDETPVASSTLFTPQTQAPFTDYGSLITQVAYGKRYAYIVETDSGEGSALSSGIRKIDLETMEEMVQRTWAGIGLGSDAQEDPFAISPQGRYLAMNYGNGNSRIVIVLNADTLEMVSAYGLEDTVTGCGPVYDEGVKIGYHFEAARFFTFAAMYVGDRMVEYLVGATLATEWFFVMGPLPALSGEDGDPIVAAALSASGGDDVLTVSSGIISDGYGDVFILQGDYLTRASGKLWQVRVHAGAPGYVDLHDAGNPGVPNCRAMIYDEEDDTVIVFSGGDGPGDPYAVKYDPNEKVVIWTSENFTEGVLLQWAFRGSRCRGGRLGWVVRADGGNSWCYVLDTRTGKLKFGPTLYPISCGVYGPGEWDPDSSSFICVNESGTGISRWYLDRVTPGQAELAIVVRDTCRRTGYSDDEFDVTELAGAASGYVLGRQSTGRALIEVLQSIFLFDPYESGYKVRFRSRGTSVVRQIEQEALVAASNDQDVYTDQFTAESELPLHCTLSYQDPEKDYQINTQPADRIAAPTPATRSKEILDLEFPGAADKDTMKRQVERALYSAWAERNGRRFRLPYTELALDPTDVVSLILDEVGETRDRLVRGDLGADMTIDCEAVVEEDGGFDSDATGDLGTGLLPNEVEDYPLVKMVPIDSNLLSDADEPATRSVVPFYLAALPHGEDRPFGPTEILSSLDGIAWDRVFGAVDWPAWGFVTALNSTSGLLNREFGVYPPQPFPSMRVPTGTPDDIATWWHGLPNHAWDQWDDEGSFLVQMVAGAWRLSSATKEQVVLTKANRALLVDATGSVEVLHFLSVEEFGTGIHTYRLTGLLRGRRGTTGRPEHAHGTLFLLLDDQATMDPLLLSLADVTEERARMFKAIPPGWDRRDVETETVVPDGNSLKPYSPCHVTAILRDDGGIDFSWVRRTRVGGELRPLTGTVPLNEDAEVYDIEVWEVVTWSPGAELRRSVRITGSPSWTYTREMQEEDAWFYSYPSDLNEGSFIKSFIFKVWQVSGQVGRGHVREESFFNPPSRPGLVPGRFPAEWELVT